MELFEHTHRLDPTQFKELMTMATANTAESAVSVSIEDVADEDWAEKVFRPDIAAKPETLYKKPGYSVP